LRDDLYEIGINRSELIRNLLQDWLDQYYGVETKTEVERKVSRERNNDLLREKNILQGKLDEVRRQHYELLRGLADLTDGQPVYGPEW
jgi:Arc/MetJ-type ribon-helix-helix transcriptional regulator